MRACDMIAIMTSAQAPSQRKLSILIIDDEESVRYLLRFGLEEAGYVVREAPNGRKGIHAFRQAPADLVITDIFMPDRDGIDVIERLRRKRPDLKIMAISGASGTMDCFEAATAAGATCVLRKPFSIRTILKTVATLFEDPLSNTSAESVA